MAEIPHDDVADEEALLAFGGVSAESVHPLLPKGLPPDEVPGAPLTPEQRLLIEEEDFYRTLFATNRTAPEVDDPHVTLVDVFKERETFAVRTTAPCFIRSRRRSTPRRIPRRCELLDASLIPPPNPPKAAHSQAIEPLAQDRSGGTPWRPAPPPDPIGLLDRGGGGLSAELEGVHER